MSESPGVPSKPEGSLPMSEASSKGTEALSRRLAELNRQIAATMESAARDVAQVGRRSTIDLLASVARIDSEDSQNGLLRALLDEAEKLASRAAFFLAQGPGYVGWGGKGFGAADSQVAGLEHDAEGAWGGVDRGVVRLDASGCADFSSRLGTSAGVEGLLIPFVLRGQLAGTLYVDRTAADELAEASLMVLVHTASLAMEIVAFRNRGASPTLRYADGADLGVERWQGDVATTQSTVPEPAVAEPEPVVVEPEPVAVEPEPVVVEPEPVAVEPEPVEPEPEMEIYEPEPVAFEPEPVEPEPEMEIYEPEPVAFEPEPETLSDALGYEIQEPSFEPTSEDLQPEPELEDTSTGWALEEENEDDEPTAVGEQAVQLEPPAIEPTDGISLEQEAPPHGVGQQTVRLDLAEIQGQAAANAQAGAAAVGGPSSLADNETATIETPVVDAPLPFAPPATDAVEPSAFEDAPAYVPPPVEPSEPEPAPVSFTPEPSSAYVPPPVEEPKAAESGDSTQVRPPENLDGPGSAFRAATETDEALHEEARRLARLLVSEIKLYNEEVIEEGRRNNDIYERLKDDIDRSRQMYQERIDPRLAGRNDYFYQELVQRLAGGDPSVLAMPR